MNQGWMSVIAITVQLPKEASVARRDLGAHALRWCKKGKRFEALKPGKRTGGVNMISAYAQKQLFAPFTVEGSCNRNVFETWLFKCLVPALKPGQVVIMDNATFHKGGLIQQLVESSGCHVLYLPP